MLINFEVIQQFLGASLNMLKVCRSCVELLEVAKVQLCRGLLYIMLKSGLMIQEWFDEHEPFEVKEVKLQSLSSGLTTTEGDSISPGKAKEVGFKIKIQLDGLNVAGASIL